MTKKPTNNYGIYVGHSLETTQEVTRAIISVLSVPHADEKTKQKALDVLTNVFKIQNVSISNCYINSPPSD